MQNRIINFTALKHARTLRLSWHKYLRYLFSVLRIYLSTKTYDIIFISLSCKKLFSTRSIEQQKRSNKKVSAWLWEYYFHQNLKFNLRGSKSFTIKQFFFTYSSCNATIKLYTFLAHSKSES